MARKERTPLDPNTPYSELPLTMDARDVADLWGVDKDTAYKMWDNMPENGFPGWFAGIQKKINRDALLRYMKVPEDIIAHVTQLALAQAAAAQFQESA